MSTHWTNFEREHLWIRIVIACHNRKGHIAGFKAIYEFHAEQYSRTYKAVRVMSEKLRTIRWRKRQWPASNINEIHRAVFAQYPELLAQLHPSLKS